MSHKSTGKAIKLLHLYPEELNIYGDRGNIITLTKRLEWRGYKVQLIRAGVGDKVKIADADLIFGGGGQDRGQIAVGEDLQRHAKALHKAADDGVPMLAICGTYQLFGRGFNTLDNRDIPGIGLFKARTFGSRTRMIGNVIIETEHGQLIGFENHSGRTILEEGQAAFGKVTQGHGNDGASGQEGARYNNAYGTYLHGPVLPKNPNFADALILAALKRTHGVTELAPLDDQLEQQAFAQAKRRPQ